MHIDSHPLIDYPHFQSSHFKVTLHYTPNITQSPYKRKNCWAKRKGKKEVHYIRSYKASKHFLPLSLIFSWYFQLPPFESDPKRSLSCFVLHGVLSQLHVFPCTTCALRPWGWWVWLVSLSYCWFCSCSRLPLLKMVLLSFKTLELGLCRSLVLFKLKVVQDSIQVVNLEVKLFLVMRKGKSTLVLILYIIDKSLISFFFIIIIIIIIFG